MFDVFAMLICSVASFLFPVFASYKALKANDPAQLTPWLMYWVVIGCVSFIESWVGWILVWVPFYQPIRACFMIWLVLPQTMGAAKLYRGYIHPELVLHEHEIEAFIARAHQQAKSAFVQNFRRFVDYIKSLILGPEAAGAMQRRPLTPAPEPGSFAQNLFARWRVPPITPYAPQMATDFYHLLSTALQQSTSSDSDTRVSTLIPPHIQNVDDKSRFIEQQYARMRVVMSALEQERANLGGDGSTSTAGMVEMAEGTGYNKRNLSLGNLSSLSGDFDHVEMSDDNDAPATAPPLGARSSSWLFGWGKGAPGQPEEGKPHEE